MSIATTISRYEVTCAVCSSTIDPGSRMFCFQPEANDMNHRPTLAWGHVHCHNPSLPPPPPCRHWKRLGRCPALQSDMCAFLHLQHDKGVDSSLDKTRWGGKRHFVRNQHKNSVFRIFLMKTYGLDYLTNDNSLIVDVAGGKGELGWELINLTGVKECVVIDPRPMCLELVQSKWKKGLFEPKRIGPVFSKWYPACEEGCKTRESRSPSHVRCFFQSEEFLDFIGSGGSSIGDDSVKWLRKEIDMAKRIKWTKKGLQHEDGSNYNEEDPSYDYFSKDDTETSGDYSSDIESPSAVFDILSKCNLIIGFHPDQAAGEIVQFAISRNIPYCIVPCCVYSQCFPKRTLKDGTKVTTYDDLVNWLCEQDSRANVATLDVEGKNKVVYTLPDK